jgi:hypothetical protein
MNDLQKVEKYLNFLRDVKAQLDTTSKISMSEYIAKHKISKRATQALQEGGILTKSGGTKNANWYWSSPVIPNIKMADELYSRCVKINNEYQVTHRAVKANKLLGKEITALKNDLMKEAMVGKVKVVEEIVDEIENNIVIEETVSHDHKFRPVQYHVQTPTQKPIKQKAKEKVAPVVEREKLFSVLWGVIKIKW